MRQLSNFRRVVKEKKEGKERKKERKCNHSLLYGPAMSHVYQVI